MAGSINFAAWMRSKDRRAAPAVIFGQIGQLGLAGALYCQTSAKWLTYRRHFYRLNW